MDGFSAQHVQLYPHHNVLEVVLSGCAGIQTSVAELQGTEQQALLCAQEALLSTNLQAGARGGLRGCRTTLTPLLPSPRLAHPS